MTDYGRGSGSDPWHPDDPLFGDTYDRGQGYQQQPEQQPQQYGGDWQDPYSSGAHQQQYPQGGGTGQYPQAQYGQQGQQGYQGQDPYASGQHQQQYPQGGGYQGYDGYDTGGHQTFDTGSHPTGGYGQQHPGGYDARQQGGYGDQYAQGAGYQQQPQQQFRQPQAGGPQPGRPMGAQGQGGPQQPAPGAARPQEPAVRPLRGAPEGTRDWNGDDDDDPREHAFFADRDDDDDEDDDRPAAGTRRSGRSSQQGGKKRRSGCACFVVAAVLLGGLGGGVYYGYGFYQDRFGPAPDYSGQGSGSVTVTIPKGATLTVMGNLLKKAGVVKSVDAFTAAAGKNPKGQRIQAGVYVLNKQMSAAAAVTMMLDPKSQNAMIIPEGWRATKVYAEIDSKLGLKEGTTAKQVKGANLGLPDWANGNIEGFLFPAKYSVAKDMKPVDLVRQMVAQAKAEYVKDGLVGAAEKAGKKPLEMLEIASLIQAEAQESGDFGKVSRVVYNRLDQGMKLEFDSTINYAMGRSSLTTTNEDIHFKSPYNTYDHKGLPPGPIDNPGHDAIEAALNPPSGDWLYFVTVKPGDTRFTSSYATHLKNVRDFNEYQKAHGG